MDNFLMIEPTAEEAAQIQEAIQQHLAEIEQLRERMQRDQAEIEASIARTDATLTRIQTQLTQLRRVKMLESIR
ncbi:MAG TPA: hypothetical protein VFB21_20345 [Chthonomonadaceae bacterium]|nr:hypothetical protein [Chthonomonadaceae bacterium]